MTSQKHGRGREAFEEVTTKGKRWIALKNTGVLVL